MADNKLMCLITLGMLAIVQNANAVDITWGGFLNATAAVSDSASPYLASQLDDRGNFNETSFGITMDIDLEDNLTLAVLLQGKEEGIELDWAFASFRLNEVFNVAVGKLKYPGNLVSEYHDVSYLYPWIRPPQEIYGHKDAGANLSLEAFNGARFLYSKFSGDIEYDAQLYLGATEEEAMNHDRMFGVVFTVSSESSQLLFGLNRSVMDRVDQLTSPIDGKVMTVLSVGATTQWHNLVVYAEYAGSETEDVPVLDTAAWYTTLGYRFGKTLPHVTYSSMDQDTGIGQSTWTLGLRRELTYSSALKLEWQRIKPEAVTAAVAQAIPLFDGLAGLFGEIPSESEINLFSVSVNVFF